MTTSNTSCLTGAAPVILAQGYVCNAGFYCHNNSDSLPPQYCPPTLECLVTRLQYLNNICQEAQGFYEPVICPPGSYCSPGGREINTCPRGHFCPLGTVDPFPCTPTSICPAGSKSEFAMDGFSAILAIDFILLAFASGAGRRLFHFLMRIWLRGRPPGSNSSPTFDLEPTVSSILIEENESSRQQKITNWNMEDPMQKRFIASVQKCLGPRNIGLSYSFENLHFTLQNGKKILSPQTGSISAGTLWGVLGASGSGKSTLIRVLTGKVSPSGGTIFVNRTPSSLSKFKRLIGYVPQDDIMVPELTVRENLMHSANVRLPSSWAEAERRMHVDALIHCLDLVHVQDSIVGDSLSSDISSGQRKRVNIGIELSAAPRALFLDEPTSGLDATSALSIMTLLKTLAISGVTIMCVIHQPRPEILQFLDRVHILGGGRQIYHGNIRDVEGYFKILGFDVTLHSNIADAILDITSGRSDLFNKSRRKVTPNELGDCWDSHASEASRSETEDLSQSHASGDAEDLLHSASVLGAPWLTQVYLCFKRSNKQQWRRVRGFFLEIIVGAVAGLLIGLSLFELHGLHFQGTYLPPFELLSSAVNYNLVLEIGLLSGTAIGLAAATPGVVTFGEEKQIYWREASSGHSRSAYYVGKTLSVFPRIALSALHFTTFYCALATPLVRFWPLYTANLGYFYCIYGLAAAVSMIVRRENGPLMAVIASLIIGVLNGYGPQLENVKAWHLEWLWRLCPGIWLTEAYFDQYLIRFEHLYDLERAARWTGFTRHRFGFDIVLLIVIGTIYRILAFLGLIFMNRWKQR
ncbi:ABC transporter-like protein [Stipitochalara longipes BDJ]|nr:ABC transporter-like protein [Stipitochalara longipes BDJ]